MEASVSQSKVSKEAEEPLGDEEPRRSDPEPSRPKEKFKVIIGPPKLTRFERARIIGARSLQLALGAPPFIQPTPDIRDPITFAMKEVEAKALPISIRRNLPDGKYQDIPLPYLL